MAFANKSLKATVRTIELDENNHLNETLLLTSFNMTSGLFCFYAVEGKFIIHSIDDRFFHSFNLKSMEKALHNVNDDDEI